MKIETHLTIGLRNNLVEELKDEFDKMELKGYENVLKAINTIPRHLFFSKGLEYIAYKNYAVEIEANQTISHPLTVALQSYYLDLQPSDKILEIGTGSGYQASILSLLSKDIYSIERHKILYDSSKLLLKKLGRSNVKVIFSDGFKGYPKAAPFDKIIVTCGANDIPLLLFEQLKIGGKMIIPIDDKNNLQDMCIIEKTDNDNYNLKKVGKFNFVPMLKNIEH